MKFYLVLCVILLLGESSLQDSPSPHESCVHPSVTFNYDMLQNQFDFINKVALEMTNEQVQIVNDVIKAESTLTTVDEHDPKPALFGFNPYIIHHLEGVVNHFTSSVFSFTTKDYDGAKKAIEMVLQDANCFQQTVKQYYP